jgi:hypothetical protein
MTVTFNGTSTSSGSTATTSSITESYTTNYVSSTTYKITLSFAESSSGSSGVNGSYTIYILKDGTILAADISISGQNENLTGSQAQGIGAGIFSGFITQIEANNNLGAYTSSSFFHSAGTSSVTIGSVHMTVTNYVANTLPETVTNCDGSTTSLTAYALSVGTPPGASGPLVTYGHFAGSTTEANGTTSTFDYVIQVTSMTLG